MNELDAKVWGVVHKGPLVFLGCFCDYTISLTYSEEDIIRNIESDMRQGHVLRLEPVMELMAPLQQVRQQAPDGTRAGVAKAPLPMPYGFTTGKTKLRIIPDAIAFINEMSEGDQKIYMAFIDSVTAAETMERANRLGLTVASSLNGGNHA